MWRELAAHLAGPFGGLLGLFYALGAASGWKFSERTSIKDLKERLAKSEADALREREECRREINDLKARVKEVEDRYTEGMERQLAQIRQSTVRVLRDEDPI